MLALLSLGLCFSRVGMVTCCQKTRKHESKENLKKSEHGQGDSGFRFCVLSNNKTVASELWTTCNNPMCEYYLYLG